MSQLFNNNASTVLVEDLLPADTTINLGPGEGDEFPLPDAGDPDSFFIATLEDVNGNYEIVKCGERSGDILTVERGQESTSPAGFATGSRCECRLTAGSLENFKQVADQYSLRGDYIDSDGQRFWHQQDPSTYQYYRIRYYTADLFGIPLLHIEPPPSLPGLHFAAGVIASDGTQRIIRLGADMTGDAPFPATGEVHFEVPGALRWSHMTNPLFGNFIYASFAKAETGPGDMFYMNPQGPDALRYRFYCQNTSGVEEYIEFDDGKVSVNSQVTFRTPNEATYSKALDVYCRNILNPSNPGNTDRLEFGPVNNQPERALTYTFMTVTEDDSQDPPVYEKRQVHILNGNVFVDQDPAGANFLTRRSWVEAQIAAATTGTGVDALAALLWGREELYVNSSGTSDDSTQTLANGRRWDDFYQVEVHAKSGDSIVVTRIDTQTLINNGYAPSRYEIFQAQGTGGDVRKVYFNPKSLTTFSGSVGGGGNGGIIAVIGLGVKVQPSP